VPVISLLFGYMSKEHISFMFQQCGYVNLLDPDEPVAVGQVLLEGNSGIEELLIRKAPVLAGLNHVHSTRETCGNLGCKRRRDRYAVVGRCFSFASDSDFYAFHEQAYILRL
jgi:hypothetical protein